MKRLYLALITLILHDFISAQELDSYPKNKPAIDTSLLTIWSNNNRWPELSAGNISNNGKYVLYHQREFIPITRDVWVVQSTENDWKKELSGITGIQFTSDNRNAVYMVADSLKVLKLGSSNLRTIVNVQNFRLVPYKNGEWLVYMLKSANKELVVSNVQNGKGKRFPLVENYVFSPDGETVILQTKNPEPKKVSLEWVNLEDGKQIPFWSSESSIPLQILVDEKSSQLAFTSEENGGRVIWHYKKGSGGAKQLIKDGAVEIDKDLVIGALDNFSKDGERLFFSLEKREEILKPPTDFVQVKVWSSKDLRLQSSQLMDLRGKDRILTNFSYACNLNSKQLIRLQQSNEKVIAKSEGFSLVLYLDKYQDVGVVTGEKWNPVYKSAFYYLVSNKNGSRKLLPWNHQAVIQANVEPQFSRQGRYLVFRERDWLHYYTYEISTGKIRNLTSKISTDLSVDFYYKGVPVSSQVLIPIAGWLKEDVGVLIYDRNDIWLVDPLGKTPPENITNGYGKKHGIVFRLLAYGRPNQDKTYGIGEKIVFAAFNKHTKENGHFSKVIGQKGDPLLINMELPLYAIGISSGGNGGDIIPTGNMFTAKDANVYLLKKETVSDFPNYYFTKDLKTFKKLTNLCPEKQYNWITSELHTWLASDGDTLQGILYKPENFDSSKKYPVLFSIYRQFSDEVSSYLKPFWSDRISIPYYVSNGYLVFTPDIHYNLPYIKQSVLNCVVSAAKHVAKLPYVDPAKMGIQGHSFGGLETGYVVTGTDVFAAVSSAAGSFDLISDDGTITPIGVPRQGVVGQSMIFKTIWENKDLYINNSPLFDADKVKSPLLIVHGERDNDKAYDQSIEFFLAMRRLEKTAWLLSYENGVHGILDPKDYKDYRIRLTQFFDHYLKQAPAPIWMARGIPARFKGIETGYALDPSGNCGKDCKVCMMWNDKWAKDSVATKRLIEKEEKNQWMGFLEKAGVTSGEKKIDKKSKQEHANINNTKTNAGNNASEKGKRQKTMAFNNNKPKGK